MIGLIVRLAAKHGTPICRNFLVTERAKAFQESYPFTPERLPR